MLIIFSLLFSDIRKPTKHLSRQPACQDTTKKVNNDTYTNEGGHCQHITKFSCIGCSQIDWVLEATRHQPSATKRAHKHVQEQSKKTIKPAQRKKLLPKQPTSWLTGRSPNRTGGAIRYYPSTSLINNHHPDSNSRRGVMSCVLIFWPLDRTPFVLIGAQVGKTSLLTWNLPKNSIAHTAFVCGRKSMGVQRKINREMYATKIPLSICNLANITPTTKPPEYPENTNKPMSVLEEGTKLPRRQRFTHKTDQTQFKSTTAHKIRHPERHKACE